MICILQSRYPHKWTWMPAGIGMGNGKRFWGRPKCNDRGEQVFRWSAQWESQTRGTSLWPRRPNLAGLGPDNWPAPQGLEKVVASAGLSSGPWFSSCSVFLIFSAPCVELLSQGLRELGVRSAKMLPVLSHGFPLVATRDHTWFL